MPTNNTNTQHNSNNIVAFSFEKHEVRGFEYQGEPHFIGNEVAAALGYASPKDAVSAHCKALKLLKSGELALLGIQSGPRGMNIIPERDVYRLVMRSNLPTAEAFEERVVGEILPAIRKTGSYTGHQPKPKRIRKPPVLTTFKTGYGIAKTLGLDDNQAASHAGRYCLNKCGENPLPALGLDSRPTPTKVNYYNVTELGKELGVSGQAMNKLLIEHGYQVKVPGGSSSAPYEPTEKGKPHARLFDEVRKGSRGSQQVLKWKHVIVSLLHPFTKTPA